MLSPAKRSEDGAVAIVVAMFVSVLLVAAAFVLDFGVLRMDRVQNKSATDAATAAGLRALEGADGAAKPWPAVCEALGYLQVNGVGGELDDLTGVKQTGAGGTVVGDPCSTGHPLQNASCTPSAPATWAWYHGTASSGRISVDIKSGYLLTDGGFPEEAYVASDSGAANQGGCDHLAVIITETRSPGLGSLVTSSDLVSRIRSVGRAVIQDQPPVVVALLLLEQHDCLVLHIEGTSGAKVVVKGNGDRPGVIHADSLGDGLGCSAADKVINQNGTVASSTIVSEKAVTGTAPGIIGVVALNGGPGAVAGNASDASPIPVKAEGQPGDAPTGRSEVTRAPVDERYLAHVKAVRDDATSFFSGTAPAGWTVLGCADVNGTNNDLNVYVDCPGGITYNKSFTFTRPGATVVYNGPVTIEGQAGTALLAFTEPRKVYVKGSGTDGMIVKAKLRINTGASTNCTQRFATDRSKRARLVVGDGPLTASGHGDVIMCQTAVVMTDNAGGACPMPADASGIDPYDNACAGNVAFTGNGVLDWTAPNAVSAAPTVSDHAELEDLALWTESGPQSDVAGNGGLHLAGVFFLPNAKPFRVAGNGLQDTREAQFIARKLTVAGGGTFAMQPDPADVIGIPYFGEFMMVR